MHEVFTCSVTVVEPSNVVVSSSTYSTMCSAVENRHGNRIPSRRTQILVPTVERPCPTRIHNPALEMLRQYRTHITTWIVPITCVGHCCTSTLQIRESHAFEHQWDVFALSSEKRQSEHPIELENGSGTCELCQEEAGMVTPKFILERARCESHGFQGPQAVHRR